jgi:ATP-dependent DNA helicase RecQ
MEETTSLDKLDNSLCFAILEAISQIPKNFGYTKTIGFLRGAKSDYIVRNHLFENAFYGCFSMFSIDQLEMIIEYLYGQSLVEIQEVGNFHRPVLTISAYGQRILDSLEEVSLKSGIFHKKDLELKDYNLYTSLRELRYSIAKKEKLPSFCICPNQVLISMANSKPTTLELLSNIKGIGPSFVEKYSSQFLELMKKFA